MTLERQRSVLRRHALAVIFHVNEGLAAELDGDREPTSARIQRVFDQLLDDRGRTLDDLARGNLVRQRGRELANPVHSHFMRRNTQSMPNETTSMMPMIHQNCAGSPPGNRAKRTFMPYSPVNTVNGMKIVAMTVSTFMT